MPSSLLEPTRTAGALMTRQASALAVEIEHPQILMREIKLAQFHGCVNVNRADRKAYTSLSAFLVSQSGCWTWIHGAENRHTAG
jgi:hypothetical protein